MKEQRENTQWSGPVEVNRRRFLEAAGFALSAATVVGCQRAPTEVALPFPDQPEGVVPGRTRLYASTCSGCPAGCGLLVGVRDGRPLKMEGMPEHPLSRGGLCATGQAQTLGLYDGQRLDGPRQGSKTGEWAEVDSAIISRLKEVAGKGAIRFVTATVTSPTLQAAIDAFLEPFNDARHVVFDAVSSSAILDAHERTHGARLLPHVRLDKADVIVSFGADFLGTWISPVEFTAGWSAHRAPTEDHPEMSYHVHFEDRLSLTGAKADKRYSIAASQYGVVLNHLAVELAKLAGQTPPAGQPGSSPVATDVVTKLAQRLWDARSHAVVLCDSQNTDVQVLVNFINELLGSYGETLDIKQPSGQRQGNDGDVVRLIQELQDGKVAALFIAGTDLTHNLPGRADLAKAVRNVPLVVSLAERDDESTLLADFVCPDHHPLESWMDAEPVAGVVSLQQPTVAPLRNTRSILTSVAVWSGRETNSAYDLLRSYWTQNILPRATRDPQVAEDPWDRALHDGFLKLKPETVGGSEFRRDSVRLVPAADAGKNYRLTLYKKIGIGDSRHAHNPWLQELPDPITKVTWDNYVCVAPSTAGQLKLSDGDVVQVQSADGRVRIELPVLVQPGQHEQTLAIALGYGVRGTDRFANIGPKWLESRPTVEKGQVIGRNAAGFIQIDKGRLRYSVSGISLKKTGRRHELALTQKYPSMEVPAAVAPYGGEVRHVVQHTTLAAFRDNSQAGTPEGHHFSDEQLWPEDHPKEAHWWGMAVDLNKCTGCSACLIACQSENNVPVVGKDEVRRSREMHWIRVDRYYSHHGDDVEVAMQPMMCQHCDNAPCETVCPVLATVHSEEGLNEQAYNRCVGTRYCANNCPYKVRRFNWFNYPHDDELRTLALNPDVTVRSRGIMEKCSMCVQRIEESRIEARRQGQRMKDGAVLTACQQSCPSQAIVFGDMSEPPMLFGVPLEHGEELDAGQMSVSLRRAFHTNHDPLPDEVLISAITAGNHWQLETAGRRYHVRKLDEALGVYEETQVRAALQNPRRYGVLEEFNFRPSVSYLRVVRNSDQQHGEDGAHG